MEILIVEDDKALRDMLGLYLCNGTQHCTRAESLAEAMEIVKVKRFDLIVLDLLLNGELSIPLIEHVRRLYPDDCPNICVMSAMRGADKMADANKVFCFIEKPFTLEKLDEMVLSNKCV